MALLRLRKLTSDSSDLCDIHCDDSNESGLCPSSCLPICPDICKTSLLPIPPPIVDYDPPNPPPHLALIWVLLISAAAAATVLIAAALFLKSRQRRRQNQDPPEAAAEEEETLDREFLDHDRRGPVVEHHIWYINTVGLQQSVIDSIGAFKYKSGEGLVDGTECSVCLSEFRDDETLRLLPKCSHAFHVLCIDTWLRSHTNCPLCRAPIVRSDTSAPPPPALAVSDSIVVEEESSENQEIESESETEGTVNRAKDSSLRRSVSLDSVSASKISIDVANNAFPEESDGKFSNTQMVKSSQETGENRVAQNRSLVKLVMASSTSTRRCLQRGSSSSSSSSLMRSLSCSGRLLLSRHNSRSRSRSRNSILPL